MEYLNVNIHRSDGEKRRIKKYRIGRWQWRIQDFPQAGANSKGGHEKLLFGQFFPQKLHENERNWNGSASLAPPWIRLWVVSKDILTPCAHLLPS